MLRCSSLELGKKFFASFYAPGANIQLALVNLAFDLVASCSFTACS
jgi:hypothetical protein